MNTIGKQAILTLIIIITTFSVNAIDTTIIKDIIPSQELFSGSEDNIREEYTSFSLQGADRRWMQRMDSYCSKCEIRTKSLGENEMLPDYATGLFIYNSNGIFFTQKIGSRNYKKTNRLDMVRSNNGSGLTVLSLAEDREGKQYILRNNSNPILLPNVFIETSPLNYNRQIDTPYEDRSFDVPRWFVFDLYTKKEGLSDSKWSGLFVYDGFSDRNWILKEKNRPAQDVVTWIEGNQLSYCYKNRESDTITYNGIIYKDHLNFWNRNNEAIFRQDFGLSTMLITYNPESMKRYCKLNKSLDF